MADNPLLSPRDVLTRLANALPQRVRKQVIVVGSLAAGFHFFGDQGALLVRTKDADCLLSPRLEAVAAGTALAQELLAEGWTLHEVAGFRDAGSPETPEDQLPVLRLDPPDNPGWFLEVLGAHGADDMRERAFDRIVTEQGHFALASFRYLALCERNPLETDAGVRIARPEAMALANLLAHPGIGEQRISQPLHGMLVKRSNKDLGRVLALAALSGDDVVGGWAETWWSDVRACFPDDASSLALRAGRGLRALLASPEDLREAHHTCTWGLLSQQPRDPAALFAVGQRLVQDAIEPLEERARVMDR